MARKTSKLETRIYEFGCLSPREGAEQECDQLWRAHRYYNAQVVIDRTRRKRFRVMRKSLVPDFESLEAEVTAAREALKSARKSERSACRERVGHAKRALTDAKAPFAVGPGQKEFRLRLKALGGDDPTLAQRRAVLDQMLGEDWPDIWKAEASYQVRAAERCAGGGPRVKEAANAAVLTAMLGEDWPRYWKLSRRIDGAALESIKRARAGSGLSWGTYLLVDTAIRQARSTTPGDVRFHRFDGTGQIGVQIHGGIDLAGLSRQNGQIWIQRSSYGEWGERRSGRNAICWMRTGSDEAGKAIWSAWPLIQHRALPDGAVVKEARIQVSRDARLRRRLQLVVEAPDHRTGPHRPTPTSGVLDVQLVGTEDSEDTNIVARVHSDVANIADVCCPIRAMARAKRCDQLQSLQDDLYISAHEVAVQLVRSVTLPPELVAMVETLHAWKSRGRLSRLALALAKLLVVSEPSESVWSAWRAYRSGGESRCGAVRRRAARAGRKLDALPDLFPGRPIAQKWLAQRGITDPLEQDAIWLDWWRRKERHLEQWRSGMRARANRHRNEVYRVWARRMADSHARLVIDSSDLRPPKHVLRTNTGETDQPESLVPSHIQTVPAKPDTVSVGTVSTKIFNDQLNDARRARAMRAPGILRQYLLEAFGPNRTTLRERSGCEPASVGARTAESGSDDTTEAAQ